MSLSLCSHPGRNRRGASLQPNLENGGKLASSERRRTTTTTANAAKEEIEERARELLAARGITI
jgi:hypothetical protein